MPDINVVGVRKAGENYLFLYRDDQSDDVLRSIGRTASQDELDFSWYDAAVLSQKVRSRKREGWS